MRRYGRFMGERSRHSPAREGWWPLTRQTLIVSACLLGVECNHKGRASTSETVVALGRTSRLIPVCPETAGGLPTPRPPAELGEDGRVRTQAGEDVTEAYASGAAHTLAVARAAGAAGAILKARSPSCGCHEVYDGTFSRRRVPGEGVTARALREAGIEVRSEEDVAAEPPAPGRQGEG